MESPEAPELVHKWTPPKPPDPLPAEMLSECGIDLLSLGAAQTTPQRCWTTCPKCLQAMGVKMKTERVPIESVN